MILQALKEYYDRKAADPDSGIAPEGWERKEIPFLVVLDQQGNFIHFEDTRVIQENRRRARAFLVPSLGEAKGNGIKANLFWENIEYMFGIPANAGRNAKRVAAQHAEFIRKINNIQGTCPALEIVKTFLLTSRGQPFAPIRYGMKYWNSINRCCLRLRTGGP